MVKDFFKQEIGYTEVYSVQHFDAEKVDDGGFWLSGFILDWVNDYDTMRNEWEQRWHDIERDNVEANGGRVLATAW